MKMYKIAILLLFLLNPYLVANAQTSGVITNFASGLKKKESGNYIEAEKYFAKSARELGDYESWYNLSVAQSRQGKLVAAKKSIERALVIAPKSQDARLELARIYSWDKQYAQAQSIIDKILAESPNNTEAKILEARLFLYQQQYDQARQILTPIKNNDEAGKLLLDATSAARHDPAKEQLRWRLSYGQSESKFSRVKQNDWRNSFANIAYKLNDKTSLSLNYEDIRRFNTHNYQIGVGVDHRFSEKYQGYFVLVNTTNATFLPRASYRTGGAAKVINNLWLLMDLQYDDYAIGAARTAKFGAQYFITKDLALTLKHVNIIDTSNKYLNGYYSRLDWTTPFEQLRLYAGYANAPETQNAVTVDTKSMFGGVSYDLNRRITLFVSYAHDDRENSFIANTAAAALAVKF